MNLVFDYSSTSSSESDEDKITNISTQNSSEHPRKRKDQDTGSQNNDTQPEKKQKKDLPELPDFFQPNPSCSEVKNDLQQTESTQEDLEKTVKSNFIPPQVRHARPNKVTEDYESWNTERRKKTPDKKLPKT